MTLAKHIVFLVCVATAVAGAGITGVQHSDGTDAHLRQILFCALCFLASVGLIAYILQFFTKMAGRILTCIFFGFFAGIMATNFIAEAVSGTTFPSLTGYMTSYGLMVLLFGLSVAGLILLWLTDGNGIAEPDAPANAGQPLRPHPFATRSPAGPRR